MSTGDTSPRAAFPILSATFDIQSLPTEYSLKDSTDKEVRDMDGEEKKTETEPLPPSGPLRWWDIWFEKIVRMEAQGMEDEFNRCVFFPYSCY